MIKKYYNVNSLYQIFFFLIVVLYSLLFPPFQFDDTDGGYIMSFSWRIANGELPYKDFLMTKPPLSAYIHCISILLLPEMIQYSLEKIGIYIFIAWYSYLFVVTINRYYNLNQLPINKWMLCSICFIFSAHNFPAMPWQTTDGVLLSSIGIFIILKKDKLVYCLSGVLFLFLAALTKQSFYFIPIIGLLLILLIHKNKTNLFFSFLFLILLILIFVFVLKSAGIFDGFIFWTTGVTTLKDLINAGFLTYIDALFSKQILLLFCVWFTVSLLYKLIFNRYLERVWFLYIFLSLTLGVSVYKCIQNYCSFCFQYYYPQLLFMLSFIYVLFILISGKNKNLGIVLSAFLLLSWSCSISWGYKTPLLFFSPIIFIFLLISKEFFNSKESFFRYLFILSFFTFMVLNILSFYPGKFVKHEMTNSLASLFPKLSFNYTNKKTYEKYKELKQIINDNGSNFSVLPGMPMAHYITNTRPTLIADWMLDSDFRINTDFFVKDFLEKHPYIILEKETMSYYKSNISIEIIKKCTLIKEYKHFKVYHLTKSL